LALLFAPDQHIEFPNNYLILFIQICFFLWGCGLIIFRNKPKPLAFIWGISFALILLLFTEVICFVIYSYTNKKIIEVSTQNLYIHGSKIGYKLHPDLNSKVCMLSGKDTIFNVTYGTDGFGRRMITPYIGKSEAGQEKFISFFGSSLTFGHGLNNNQTYPSYIQQYLPDYKIYNYAVGGYGTHQVYTQIMERDLRKEITEQNGVGIYHLIRDHIHRSIGRMDVYNLWGKNMPYYTLSGDSIIYNGNFTSGRKCRAFIYNLLGKSYLLKLCNFYWPTKIQEEDIALVVKLIEKSAGQFKSQFKNAFFYVLITPTSNFQENQDIINFLKKSGIEIIDCGNLYNQNDAAYKIAGDPHPSAKANEEIAICISEFIKGQKMQE
jgi:hypothetical protein